MLSALSQRLLYLHSCAICSFLSINGAVGMSSTVEDIHHGYRELCALNATEISTSLVGISMFIFFDWRMVLASFWVIPASFLLVWASAGYQKRAVRKNNGVKLELADGIQECLETVRDLRANNAQDSYMDGLDVKIKRVEKEALFTELKLAVCVNSVLDSITTEKKLLSR